MNLPKLYELQAKLDQNILTSKDIEHSDLITEKKYIALKVEIGEFLNDIQAFKYWKQTAKPKESALEEGIDVIHFLLSYAIDRGWHEYIKAVEPGITYKGINELSRELFDNRLTSAGDYLNAFLAVLQILGHLGYSVEDVEHAYLEKNLTNHQRQAKGY